MAVILRRDGGHGDVVVFGSGTIGGPVLQHLTRHRSHAVARVPVPWADAARRVRALGVVHDCLRAHGPIADRRISIVWAAGKAGFSASQHQVADERAAYEDVLALATQLGNDPRVAGLDFHLVSSAGGLFEGQHVRSASSEPRPVREYGHLKLWQELVTRRRLTDAAVIVYRPSSVYAASARSRRGLVGALVRNGLAHRVTTIHGRLETLRDYVFADDVGRYIADRVGVKGAAARDMHLLVSGQPASIQQIIAEVEAVIRRPVYLRIAPSTNASDITFLPRLRPPDLGRTSLQEGVRRVFAATLGSRA